MPANNAKFISIVGNWSRVRPAPTIVAIKNLSIRFLSCFLCFSWTNVLFATLVTVIRNRLKPNHDLQPAQSRSLQFHRACVEVDDIAHDRQP